MRVQLRTELLQQILQLLVQVCLGGFHGHELRGHLLFVRLDDAFEFGDLRGDAAGLIGQRGLVRHQGTIVTDRLVQKVGKPLAQTVSLISEKLAHTAQVVA